MNQKFALIIGTTEYDDADLARLTTPDKDVNDLAEVLQSPEIGGFEVNKLISRTWAILQEAIADFFADRKPDDLLLLYFSGHGVLDEQGRLFLAAKNTRHNRLSGSAISASFIVDEMDRCRSRHQVLILDCCHSGAFARGAKGKVKAVTQATFEGGGSGRIVLTATDAMQYAWEGSQIVGLGQAENSVFTYYLVEGLRTGDADRNKDGWVTLDELYDYVYEQVRTKTPKQTPSKWSYKQQGKLVIAKNSKLIIKNPRRKPEYRNFEVKDNNEFRVIFKNLNHVYAQTPSGFTPKGSVQMKSQEERMIQMIENLLLKESRVNRQDLEALGVTLYEILFGGEMGTAFKATYEKIQEQPNAWLRLIIEFLPEVRHLADLPWESIFIPFNGTKGFFLSTHPRVLLTRHVQSETATLKSPIRASSTPRTLIIVSIPIDFEEVDPEPIIRPIEELSLVFKHALVILHQTTLEHLLDGVRQFKPDVIHFIGVAQYGSIALVDENQRVHWVGLNSLIHLLDTFQPQLFFLQNCMSPKSMSYQAYEPYQAFRDAAFQLAQLSMIPAVMTTQYPMDARELVRFTEKFYQLLLEGNRLDIVVKKAMLHSIVSQKDLSLPQISPILYLPPQPQLFISTQNSTSL